MLSFNPRSQLHITLLLDMASPVFFMGTGALALLAQPALCASEASSTSPPTVQHEPDSEQYTSPLPDTADISLQHTRRRLSTIIEENEEEAQGNACDKSGARLGKRRVSLQKSGWTVAKGEPISPPIDGKRQSSSVQAHLSIPPTSPNLTSSLKREEAIEFSSWDQQG